MPKPEIPQGGTNTEDRNMTAARQTVWHSDFGLLSDLRFRVSDLCRTTALFIWSDLGSWCSAAKVLWTFRTFSRPCSTHVFTAIALRKRCPVLSIVGGCRSRSPRKRPAGHRVDQTPRVRQRSGRSCPRAPQGEKDRGADHRGTGEDICDRPRTRRHRGLVAGASQNSQDGRETGGAHQPRPSTP